MALEDDDLLHEQVTLRWQAFPIGTQVLDFLCVLHVINITKCINVSRVSLMLLKI